MKKLLILLAFLPCVCFAEVQGYEYIQGLSPYDNNTIKKVFDWAWPVLPNVVDAIPTSDDLAEQTMLLYKSGSDIRIYYNIDGTIDYLPFGILGYDSTDDVLTINKYIRSETANYKRYYHFAIGAFNPGASGATWTPGTASYMGGWQIDAAGEVLYAYADVHDDWDGSSDIDLEWTFTVNVDNSGGLATDTVDMRIVCYYAGSGETSPKTQTVEVAIPVGACAQYTVFSGEEHIDWDATGNVIEMGDTITFSANLETDTSEVDNIIINSASFHYSTTHVGVEDGDS